MKKERSEMSVLIDRRDLLRLGAAGLAGAALAPGPAAAAEGDPVIDFARLSCGESGPRVLVGYASLCGSTGEIAAAIGKKFCAAGLSADVRHLPDVDDLTPYTAFILGSPIQAGMWIGEATKFLREHQDELARFPVAYFIACMAMSSDKEQSRKLGQTYVERPLRVVPKIKPVAFGMFAGKVDYAKMPKRYHSVMRRIVPQDMDARDWPAVERWAEEVGNKLANR